MIPPITELGSIVIDDLICGDRIYDLQIIKVNSVKTQTYGKLSIVADITRAIS